MRASHIATPTRTDQKEEEIKPWWFWPHLHWERKLIVKLLDTSASKYCEVTALGCCPKWLWDPAATGGGDVQDNITTIEWELLLIQILKAKCSVTRNLGPKPHFDLYLEITVSWKILDSNLFINIMIWQQNYQLAHEPVLHSIFVLPLDIWIYLQWGLLPASQCGSGPSKSKKIVKKSCNYSKFFFFYM